jgi:hypothetical protein
MEDVNDLSIEQDVLETGEEILSGKKDTSKGSRQRRKTKYKNYQYISPVIHQPIIIREVGRPTVMTPEVVEKILWACAKGYNDRESSLFAGIDRDTLINYKRKFPSFSAQMEAIRENPNMMAKTNLIDSIMRGNVEDSKWWLVKRNKEEFGEPENPLFPNGATVFQQVEKIAETQTTTTTVKSKTLAYINSKKPDAAI